MPGSLSEQQAYRAVMMKAKGRIRSDLRDAQMVLFPPMAKNSHLLLAQEYRNRLEQVKAQEQAMTFAAASWLAKQVCAQQASEGQLEEWMRVLRKGFSQRRSRRAPRLLLAAIPEVD